MNATLNRHLYVEDEFVEIPTPWCLYCFHGN